MKTACLIIAAFLAVPSGSQTGPVTTADRDLALKQTQVCHLLGQNPLWPPGPGSGRTYRVTILAALYPWPESVTLTVLPDGSGQVEYRTVDPRSRRIEVDSTRFVEKRRLTRFTTSLDHIQFWKMPTQPPPSKLIGLDGAEWLMETVQDGKYHVVERWCPGGTPFGKAAKKLFELSGRKPKGAC